MVWLRMAGLAPKRRFHRLQLRMTVELAEGVSSPAVKSRPRAGCTPRVREQIPGDDSRPEVFPAFARRTPKGRTRLLYSRARSLKLLVVLLPLGVHAAGDHVVVDRVVLEPLS